MASRSKRPPTASIRGLSSSPRIRVPLTAIGKSTRLSLSLAPVRASPAPIGRWWHPSGHPDPIARGMRILRLAAQDVGSRPPPLARKIFDSIATSGGGLFGSCLAPRAHLVRKPRSLKEPAMGQRQQGLNRRDVLKTLGAVG